MRFSIVTSNQWKVEEFRNAMEPFGIKLEKNNLDCEEIQADSLQEVVKHCLLDLKERGVKNALLDDSGLFIKRLNGFPGVYSSYIYKTLGCKGILKLMEGENDREAYFECCIGCILNEEEILISERTYGRIECEMRGTKGFGFDKIFVTDEERRTFAYMPIEEKNKISHRGKAIASLIKTLMAKHVVSAR
ncbi:MAG: RdgB/HAM1 family non-canonical purine NTP pyrophosphatase [Methanomassiliicoccales archaeon]